MLNTVQNLVGQVMRRDLRADVLRSNSVFVMFCLCILMIVALIDQRHIARQRYANTTCGHC